MNDEAITILYKRLRSHALGKPYRSRRILDAVKAMKCARCNDRPPSDPHHVFGSAGPLKSSDYTTVPLCRECHEYVEAHPKENAALLEALFLTMLRIIADLDAHVTTLDNRPPFRELLAPDEHTHENH